MADVDSLVAFLLACLDDDEREAQAAFSNQADPEHGWGVDGRAVTPHVGVIHEDVQRAHVVKWNPARVLAEVEAKRAILDLHQIDRTEIRGPRFDEHSGRPLDPEWEVTCSVCGWAGLDPLTECRTLRLLAQPYAGRPGWRDEWRMS